MPKKIMDMTKKELGDEYIGIMQSIEHTGFSVRDLRYQDALEAEIYRRGYEIRANYKIVKAWQ